MTEAVGLCPLTVPATTNPANFVLMKSQTQVACAVGMDFLQGIRPLLHAHFCLRGAKNTALTSTEKSLKVTLTELPNWEINSFDTPATTSRAKVFSWEKEWENLAVIVQNN